MFQIIEQTFEEKMAMYMKLSKKELAQMLIAANEHLGARQQVVIYPQQLQPVPTYPNPYDLIWVIPQPGTIMYSTNNSNTN